MRFFLRWRDEAIILLRRSGTASEAKLLALEERELTVAESLVVSNQLLAIRSRPFFLRVAKRKRFEHYFYVYDVKTEGGWGSGIGDGFPSPEAIRRVPEDFPPVGIYTLETNSSSGDTLLSTGPCEGYSTVTYSRVEVTESGTPVRPRDRSFTGRPDWCADAYLAAFQNMPLSEAKRILQPSTDIHWINPAAFRLQTNVAMEHSVRNLRAFLLSAGIGPLIEGTAFSITITPKVTDARRNKRVRLPEVAPKKLMLN